MFSARKKPITKEPCFEDNTAYFGNNQRTGGENPQKTRLDCQQSCEFHPSCHFWSFRKPDLRSSAREGAAVGGGLCYLKLKRENVTPNVTDYISGSKYCQLPESERGDVEDTTKDVLHLYLRSHVCNFAQECFQYLSF